MRHVVPNRIERSDYEAMLYIREDFSMKDLSAVNMSSNVYVECSFWGAIFPEGEENYRDVKFVDCDFSITATIISSGGSEYYLNEFYCSDIRVINPGIQRKVRRMFCDTDSCRITCTLLRSDLDFPTERMDDYVYKVVSLDPPDVIPCKMALATLWIPPGTNSCWYANSKCRAEKAEVIDIEDLYGNKYNTAYSLVSTQPHPSIIYVKGEMVRSDRWVEDRVVESTHGIHFFTTPEMAWYYAWHF